MLGVTVSVHPLVDGAGVGAVRLEAGPGRPVILIHEGLPMDEQAELLAELTLPGEILVFASQVPAQRSPVEDDLPARVS